MIAISISDEEFALLARYIKNHFGIHLKEEKKTLLVGRLQQVLHQLGMTNFSQYYQYLISDQTGQASNTLINNISTNHTYFMRETDHFDFFKNTAIPNLARNIKDYDFRIWCAGCSSGEEAYTLAMILEDCFGSQFPAWDKKMLATDISTKALEKAVKGIYTEEAIANLPVQWKSNYFDKLNTGLYTVKQRVKNEIYYRKFNLMSNNMPFKKKFHIIFCRNVMIYFDTPTKNKLIQQFYEATEPGGYLFLGHSEALERTKYGYQYVRPSVYRRLPL